MSRIEELTRFYSIIDRLQENLGEPRRLMDCSGRMDWPARGVYFFQEFD
jgi:hypothetical protein